MPFDGGGLFALTLLGRLLVEFASAQFRQDTRLFTGTLEATQGGVKIFIFSNTNAGHSNLNNPIMRAAGIRRQGGAF